MDFAIEIYRETANFPRDEIYSLTQQMRRAAVSIASNIAEGKGRKSRKEFEQFVFHARGSLLELQTQTMIASRLNYISEARTKLLLEQAAGIGRSLKGSLIPYHRPLPDFANSQEPTAKSRFIAAAPSTSPTPQWSFPDSVDRSGRRLAVPGGRSAG